MIQKIDAGYRLIPVLMVASVMLAACSGREVVGSSETHVWIRDSLLSITSSKDLAQEHCAKYGRTATLESDLSVSGGGDSILVFKCE